ncbi:MAG TPA: hypothetical protein VK911_00210 [Vicinamibacterales bacterium]|nr:hypothetical protein [Vicinamibacterales bacterium]
MSTAVRRLVLVLVAGVLMGATASTAYAQESKSAALVKELGALLDGAKLDAIAAKDSASKDTYFAALYFPGSQLLVVSARYEVPVLLDERLEKREYRDVYTDLNSACVEGTKYLVMDIGADGLKPRKDDTHFDTIDTGARSYVFDGSWRDQKMASEDEYLKAYTEAEQRYTRMLTALIGQLKKR